MTNSTLTIEINGNPLTAEPGQMVIQVADAAGIHIPRFCYHPKLTIAANCRMCLVEVARSNKPLPACATPVANGMKVQTRSPLALRAQKSVMEFLLINHPLDCPICDQGGECELQDVAMGYGHDISRFTEYKRVVADPPLGPLVATDMTRCIHCTRCVRFCEEIAATAELGMTGRGEGVRIDTYVAKALESELSGNIIDLCPVGALTSKPFRFQARAWEMEQHAAVAVHDAVGSNIYLQTRRGRVLRVIPRDNEALNEVWLSDRDRFSYTGLYTDDRLQKPAIKHNGQWHEVDWQSAFAFVVDGLSRVRAQHGDNALGGLSCASATVEEQFLLQRLIRGLGCGNIDHRLRQVDFRAVAEAPVLSMRLAEVETIDALLLLAANPRHEQPMFNHRLRKAALGGARIARIDALSHAFNYPIDHDCIVAPARFLCALAAIARALGISSPILSQVSIDSDLSATAKTIAEQLENAKRGLIVLGGMAVAHPQFSLLHTLAAAIVTKIGGHLAVLSHGANAAGAYYAGALPDQEGLNALQMITQPRAAYVLLGVEPELDCVDSGGARQAMQAAEFVVCLSAWRSAAMENYADVLLPIAGFAESDGTTVNLQGDWQSFSAAVPPLGEARPAWKVLRVLGNRFDLTGFDQHNAAEVLVAARTAKTVEVRPSDQSLLPWMASPSSTGQLQRIGEVPAYAVDMLVRRAAPLQQALNASQPQQLRLHSLTCERLGLSADSWVTVSEAQTSIPAQVLVDDTVAVNCATLAAGIEATVGLGQPYALIQIDEAQQPDGSGFKSASTSKNIT